MLAAVVLGGLTAAPAAGNPPGMLSFGGLQRSFVLHVPAGLGQPNGLVINLHGAGMTGGQQAAVTGYNAVADQNGFIVAYPDGIDTAWADGRGAARRGHGVPFVNGWSHCRSVSLSVGLTQG